MSRAAEHFAEELNLLLNRVSMEYTLTCIEAIGVLELAKASLVEEANEPSEED